MLIVLWVISCGARFILYNQAAECPALFGKRWRFLSSGETTECWGTKNDGEFEELHCQR